MAAAIEGEPRHHIEKMQARLKETIDHLRSDIDKVSGPQLRAMFESAAEALTGLKTAFSDDGKKNEKAWRKSSNLERRRVASAGDIGSTQTWAVARADQRDQ